MQKAKKPQYSGKIEYINILVKANLHNEKFQKKKNEGNSWML